MTGFSGEVFSGDSLAIAGDLLDEFSRGVQVFTYKFFAMCCLALYRVSYCRPRGCAHISSISGAALNIKYARLTRRVHLARAITVLRAGYIAR